MDKSKQLGAGRRFRKDYYGAVPARPMTLNYETFDLWEIREFLSFWQARKGSVERFWLSSQLMVARLAESAVDQTNKIIVEDASSLRVGMVIAIEGIDEENQQWAARVESIDGNEVTLDAEIGAFEYGATTMRELLLVHCEHTFLRLTWGTDEHFTAELAVREVPAERLAHEVPGQTIGALPLRKTLYTIFDREGFEECFTSHESDLQWDGKVFANYPISHGKIKSTITLSDSCTVSVQAIAGSPFVRFANVQTNDLRRLWCKIERVEIIDGEVTRVVRAYQGEFLKPRVDFTTGKMRLQCAAISRDLEKKCPQFKHQALCNWQLYGAGCGLIREDNQHTATVLVVDASLKMIKVDYAKGIHDPSIDTLVMGYVMIGAVKNTINGRIVNADGTLSLRLNDPKMPSVDDTITIQSGCDGLASTCRSFGNFDNWGGNKVAVGNLSLVQVTTTTGGGGKK